jgi:hypothetical protein
MNDEIEILKRRIELKEQLIAMTKEEIEDLLIDIEILSREIPDEQEKN